MASQAFVYGYYETLEKLAAPTKPKAGTTQYGSENMTIDPGQAPALGGRAPATIPRRGGSMNFEDSPGAPGAGGSMGVNRTKKIGAFMKMNADMQPPPLNFNRKPANVPMPPDTRGASMPNSQGGGNAGVWGNTAGRPTAPGASPAPGPRKPMGMLAQQ